MLLSTKLNFNKHWNIISRNVLYFLFSQSETKNDEKFLRVSAGYLCRAGDIVTSRARTCAFYSLAFSCAQRNDRPRRPSREGVRMKRAEQYF